MTKKMKLLKCSVEYQACVTQFLFPYSESKISKNIFVQKLFSFPLAFLSKCHDQVLQDDMKII